MGILANLGVKLSLNSAEFKAGLDDATKNLQKFEANQKKSFKNAQAASAELGSTLAKVTAGVAAFGFAFMKVLQKSDEIADMAAAFDSSIGSIVGMGKAMDLAGGKAENLGNLLSKLSANADNAREGNDKLRDSFRAVGVTAGEVENLNPDQLFERVAQQLAKIEDPVTRNAKAMELLGKAAKGIDWNKYVDEYKQVADPELAAAIQTSADAWDNINKAIGGTYYFIVKMIQPLAALVNELATLADRYREFKQEGGNINFDPDNPMGAGIDFAGTGKPAAGPEKPKSAKLATDKYKRASEKETGLAEQRAKEIAAIREAFKIRVEELNTIGKQIQRETELIGLTTEEAERKKLRWAIEDENLKMQLDLEKQIQLEKAKTKDMDLQKIRLLEAEQAAYKVLTDITLENAQKDLESKEAKIRAQQILTDTEKAGFDQAVDNFQILAQNSKAAFAVWKAMAITQTIIDTYKAAQGSYASLSSIPYIGPALGIAAAAAAIAAGMARVNMIRSQDYQGREKGGSMVANTPYIVGERGPELVVPHRGGTVIPNNQLSSALGGGGGPTYNGPYIANLSAIDTQSGLQFIARNKSAIWAANMSASRSLPNAR
jgi:hypothetical protein